MGCMGFTPSLSFFQRVSYEEREEQFGIFKGSSFVVFPFSLFQRISYEEREEQFSNFLFLYGFLTRERSLKGAVCITIVDDQLCWSSLIKKPKMTNDEFQKTTFQEDQM